MSNLGTNGLLLCDTRRASSRESIDSGWENCQADCSGAGIHYWKLTELWSSVEETCMERGGILGTLVTITWVLCGR